MQKLKIKSLMPHLFMMLAFVLLALVYFSPVLQGKKINQSDIRQYIGMAKQQNDFRAANSEETYWTNSAFGGMPTYQLGAKYPHNYIKKLDLTLRFLPRPADYLFLYFMGFYVLLLVLKLDYKLAGLGALAFGFSTYLIIILGVGHNAKAHAIAYMPLVLSGILLAFQKKYVGGFLLTTVALGLHLVANHFQMTYYLLFLVLILGIVYLIDFYKKNKLTDYFKIIGLLSMAAIMALALNATNIMATQQYSKESTRGVGELTINPDGSQKQITSGLDKNYITEYSYGKLESFNLFIPRLLGGGNGENLGKQSHTYEAYRKLGAGQRDAIEASKRVPMYWGDQPIVEAPAYLGAVVVFLFFIGVFLVNNRLKWWLVSASVFSLLLSFGKNFSVLTDFFINYIPLYTKFRAVSSIQVILELCVPALGVLGLSKIIDASVLKQDKIKALKLSTIITAGVAILFLLIKSSFDFSGSVDGFFKENYGQAFVDALIADRKSIYTFDVLRSLILVLASAVIIWCFLKQKLTKNITIIAFAILLLFDLVVVDKRYVNFDDFIAASKVDNPYQKLQVDATILEDKSHYRVFDLTTNSTRPSYYHNSLSGYSAVSMKRYNELFDFYISRNAINVLNMLNAKYIIAPSDGANGAPQIFKNTEALGNAWFVKNIKWVDTANAEILALDTLNTATTAVIMQAQKKEIDNAVLSTNKDSLAEIKLLKYKPNHLVYQSKSKTGGLAVFSENYYKHGWQAYIDNKPVKHLRANYVLRALQVPSGSHEIVFKFEPQVIKTGSRIALISSILLMVLIISGLYYQFSSRKG